MEEQKNNSKEVRMHTARKGNAEKETEQPQKYTYDELNEIANKLFNENRYLRQQLQQAENTLRSIERLEYLFRIVELASKSEKYHFKDNFVCECVQEIEDALTPAKQEENSNSEEN